MLSTFYLICIGHVVIYSDFSVSINTYYTGKGLNNIKITCYIIFRTTQQVVILYVR